MPCLVESRWSRLSLRIGQDHRRLVARGQDLRCLALVAYSFAVVSSSDVPTLKPVEHQLLHHVSGGEWLDLAVGKPVDKAAMASWGAERTVRAAVIRDILRGRLAADPDPHGVRIRGARLAGRLDLESLSTQVNLELQECFLPEGLAACDADLSVLRLGGCRVEHPSGAAVAADRLRAPLVVLNGTAVVGHGACGAVSLAGAHITRVECDGAVFFNDSGPALFAEAVQVEQDMFLRGGFRGSGAGDAGAVCLLAARLSRLECDGAKLRNDSGPAFRGDSMVVDQRACLRDGFEALGAGEFGAVRLNGARIGLLLCDSAKFVNNSGPVLVALAMHVERGIFMRDGFEAVGAGAAGALRMPGARMTRLECRGAKLRNSSGPVLFAEAMQVEQDVLLCDGFEADGSGHDGAVCLIGARIGGRLALTDARLLNRGDEHSGKVALNAERLAVGGDILGGNLTCQGEVRLDNAEATGAIRLEEAHLSNPGGWPLTCQHLRAHELALPTLEPLGGAGPVEGVDLRHAEVDLLRDTPGRWPARLRLDGLSYGALDPPGTSEQRQDWLRRDYDGYRPQPYEQLASRYRQLGNDKEARNVLLAGQRRRRESLGPIPKAWGYLQDFTVGYGYRPWYSALWLTVLLIVGTVSPSACSTRHPSIVPTQPSYH